MGLNVDVLVVNLLVYLFADPGQTVDKFAWTSDPLAVAAIAVTFGCLILVVVCVSCWVCQSRERCKEHLMCKNSIRASIRSNRSAMSTTSGGFREMGRRRIIEVSADC